MTSPTLPSFVKRSTRPVYQRPPTRQRTLRRPHRHHRPSFFERHGDRISFLWSCLLVAALVHAALS